MLHIILLNEETQKQNNILNKLPKSRKYIITLNYETAFQSLGVFVYNSILRFSQLPHMWQHQLLSYILQQPFDTRNVMSCVVCVCVCAALILTNEMCIL